MEANNDILLFYGIWQLFVSLFAFLALITIWWHLGEKQGDRGQVYLAFSILCWCLLGGVEIYYSFQDQSSDNALQLAVCRSIASLINSGLILMSLPWFRYLSPFTDLIKNKLWFYLIGISFLTSLSSTIIISVIGSVKAIVIPDIVYAGLTLFFLGFVLWNSFSRRGLQSLAWLAVIGIGIVFIAQVFKYPGLAITSELPSAIFKTFLIMIFFALALSWVKEQADNPIPGADHLILSLRRKKILGANKYENRVRLQGIKGSHKDFILTDKPYELLRKFVVFRLEEKDKKEEKDKWLEIAPSKQNRPGTNYDIKEHQNISRMLDGLLKGLFREEWQRDLYKIPLKETLFERSRDMERRVRLAIPPTNLRLEEES